MTNVVFTRSRGIYLASVLLFSATFERVATAAPLDSIQPTADFRASPYIKKARNLQLADKKTWLRLGHWRKTRVLRNWISEADGQGFFLADKGKTSPEQELDKTIEAFFAAPSPEHAICKFPARFLWLSKHLHFDPSELPTVNCERFKEYYDFVAPNSATVVFSSYYLGSPASAFGHTLLRINKRDVLGGRQELLDTGINYSASVDTDNGLVYAIKGLTGLFRGEFSRMPYYYKVREYGDYEARDLWEYKLDLTQEQLTMLVSHIWELGSTYFDYYYLSENCSYHLLAALEAANPKLELLKGLKYPVIPADTVKAINDSPGLVTSVNYRPSLRSQFKSRIAKLDLGERRLVRRLASNALTKLPNEMPVQTKGKLFDAATDLIDLEHPDDVLSRKESPAATRRQSLLVQRAQLRAPSPPVSLEAKARDMPHLAHGSRRLGFGGGYSNQGGAFAEASVRIALHDLVDPPTGYPELSALEFLPTRVRYSENSNKFDVRSASLLRFTHLIPVSSFQQKLSWDVKIGFDRTLGECNCGIAGASFGPGVTFANETESLAFFSFLDTAVGYAPDLNDSLNSFRIGGGPKAGLRLRFSDRLVGLTTGIFRYFPKQKEALEWQWESTVRWQIANGFTVDARGTARPGTWESALTLHTYY